MLPALARLPIIPVSVASPASAPRSVSADLAELSRDSRTISRRQKSSDSRRHQERREELGSCLPSLPSWAGCCCETLKRSSEVTSAARTGGSSTSILQFTSQPFLSHTRVLPLPELSAPGNSTPKLRSCAPPQAACSTEVL